MFKDSSRCIVIVGAQWGDEGKGKITDVLAEQATLVARYQGGANAGHTVLVKGEEFILHLIPSGALVPDVKCVLGNGVVVDPWTLLDEIDVLEGRGIGITERLIVSRRAHLVMPYHRMLDGARESLRGEAKIGTTKRGIGPAYRDKVARTGLRVCDLEDLVGCESIVRAACQAANGLLQSWDLADRADPRRIMADLEAIVPRILPLAGDSGATLLKELNDDGRVLLEGAQGSLLDVDHGTYPYVTSSNTTAGAAAAGVGIGPTLIDGVLGVVKAYTTRVGNGPLPTELQGDEADLLRRLGAEFGATTGRPRRPGWYDGAVVRHAAAVNGLTALAVTKLDVLDTFEELKLGTGYTLDGGQLETFPDRAPDLGRVEPVYETTAGWGSDTTGARSWEDLPGAARTYLERIEANAEVPIRYVSVGSARDQIVRVPIPRVA
ncbi:MAG: adenylosuccinate synthase [marine benthic group bacterium]|nr:adenylosuccinate synthase [Gemmatimonadota bacterium]MCL7956589.1 adenylosuccinate synthase [Gemmatimonadota bacterium]MCL7980633.1 adenylosuccinate synthase [Gemmatimonadota bacterium]